MSPVRPTVTVLIEQDGTVTAPASPQRLAEVWRMTQPPQRTDYDVRGRRSEAAQGGGDAVVVVRGGNSAGQAVMDLANAGGRRRTQLVDQARRRRRRRRCHGRRPRAPANLRARTHP